MVKTVTYGIEYKKTDTLQEGVNYYLHHYNLNLKSHKDSKAYEFLIELLEWLTTEEELQIEKRFRNALKLGIQYCNPIQPNLTPSDPLLKRLYEALSQAYLLLKQYPLAIQHATQLLSLPPPHQPTYRILGNLYFTKSLDPTHARHSDLHQALAHYQSELPLTDPSLLQASCFNRGVMEARLGLTGQAESNLRRAIALARHPQDQKTAWWELGLLFKRLGQAELVKECQREEFWIVRKFDLLDDHYPCFEERMKYHLFLGDHDFHSLYHESIEGLDSPKKAYKDLLEWALYMKSLKDELDGWIEKGDLNAPIASKYLDYVETLKEYDLDRLVIKTVDSCLHSLLNARDFDHLTLALLLYYKFESMWALRESTKEDYFKASNEVFEYVEANLLHSPLNQLQLTIDIFKLRIKIHQYYDQTFQMESCKQLLTEAIKKEKAMRQKFANNYPMDLDFPEHTRITPAIHKTIKTRIKVKILLDPNPIEFNIQYEHTPETVQKLMNDISTRCWIQYGIEPVLSHIRTLNHDIFPEDYTIHLFKEENQLVEGFVKSINRKPPFITYLNACDRFKIKPIRHTEQILYKQTLTHLSFMGLNISADQLKPLEQVIQQSHLLQSLSLASNGLKNHELMILLQHANKGLGELILDDNELKVECLSFISDFQLRTLSLSHNPIGPEILNYLPHFLNKIPSLKHLALKNINLGQRFKIEDDIKESYLMISGNQVANLSLDISHHHFEFDMLQILTFLLSQIKRIHRLELSSITSDFGWHNFDLLSDLPKLSELSFKYSIKQTIEDCHFKEFFSIKTRLNHIDFTSCQLTSEDMVTLSYGLNQIIKLRRLTLNSNPDIGDEGLIYLDDIIMKSKIDILDLSHCNLSHSSLILLTQWRKHLRQIDLTENPNLYHYSFEPLFLSTHTLQFAMVKLNPYKDLKNDENQSSLNQPISYQPTLNLPDSPF